MPNLKLPPNHWYTRLSKRRSAVKARAKELIRTGLAADAAAGTEAVPGIANDEEFIECFVDTSPLIAKILGEAPHKEGKTNAYYGVPEHDVVLEAHLLHEALGDSTIVLAPGTQKSKYASGFSFVPEIEPSAADHDVNFRDMVCVPDVTDEGPVPTFFQFEVIELPTILARYAQHAGHHGPDHICRSLILAKAMANYYLKHGQKQYLPMAGTANGQRDTTPIALPAPTPKEVDISTICFAVGFHDSGRTTDGPDVWEHQSGRNAYYYMRELHYSIPYAANVADIIVKNEENAAAPQRLAVSRTSADSGGEGGSRNAARAAAVPGDELESINEMITHDADTLEIHRVLASRAKDNTFREAQFKFLEHKDFDDGLNVSGSDRAAARAAIIADAKLFAESTSIKAASNGVEPAKTNMDRFLPFASPAGHPHTGFDAMHAEFERLIIDEIFRDASQYPFLYEYYFLKCFDPACPQLRLLSSESRLAVIRARMHAMERLPRDRHWADSEVARYNAHNTTDYTVDKIVGCLRAARLTMNLNHAVLKKIVTGFDDSETDPLYKQKWEMQAIWNREGGRPGGGGASNSDEDRDFAERRTLGYITHRDDPHFDVPCAEGADGSKTRPNHAGRPNYTALNTAKVPHGHVGKYGKCVVYLKPRIKPRVTLTFRDTFNKEIKPDHACTLAHPLAVLRCIGTPPSPFGLVPGLVSSMAFVEGWANPPAEGKGFRGMCLGAFAGDYIEAHVHGPISWKDDVDTILIDVGSADAPSLTDAEYDQVTGFATKWGIAVAYTKVGIDAVFKRRADALAATAGQDPAASVERVDLFTPPPGVTVEDVEEPEPPKFLAREPKRRASDPPLPILMIEDAPPTDAEGRTCDLWTPNPGRAGICRNCESTPSSKECVRFGKSADDDVTWTSQAEARADN
jgi:hypothetical protein